MMPDGVLIPTRPFFDEDTRSTNELWALYEESYCHGYHDRCGRYTAFKALERELKIIKESLAVVNRSNGDGEA